jgi:aspartyl-tRNA(Asn)/glutamyl-tRNA(Gln) amidotransferase subunit B
MCSPRCSRRANVLVSIVEEKGLRQVTDTGAIDAVIDAVIAKNQDKLAEYRAGKDKLFGFFVGQVMKESGGKANPAMVNEALKAKLAGLRPPSGPAVTGRIL